MAFKDDYDRLERAFKKQIGADKKRIVDEAKKISYLPNKMPNGKVDFILVGTEPSIGWAANQEEAQRDIAKGFRNFYGALGDFILHHCIREYLCLNGEKYYLTDLSKSAMLTSFADVKRNERYADWYPFLERELRLVGKKNVKIISIGKVADSFLKNKGLKNYMGGILHYSQQAVGHRGREAKNHPDCWSQFRKTFRSASLKRTIRDVMTQSDMTKLVQKTLTRLKLDEPLSESNKELIFTYKVQFGRIREKISSTS